MSVTTNAVRLDFADYVLYTETHPDGAFELLDGAIYKLAPEGDAHLVTRSGIHLYLSDTVDRSRFTPWTEASFPAPGWADGPRPDNFVSRGPWRAAGQFSKRPTAEEVLLVVEVSSSSRPKDRNKAQLYARLGIPEYWLVDLVRGEVIVHRDPAPANEVFSYANTRIAGTGECIASSAVDGLSVDTNFLLELAS